MKINKRIKWVLFITIGLCFLYFLPTIAKFVTDRATSYYLRTKHFYFSSNLLDTQGSTYQIGTWGGVGDFSISFDLYSKENTLLFSDSDIAYTVSVTCSQDASCTLSEAGGVLYSSDVNHTKTITVNVMPQRVFLEGEQLDVHLVASSTSPYVKSISADFEYIVGAKGVSYYITDVANQPYFFLHVTNDVDYCTVVTAFGDYSVGDNISFSTFRTLNPSDRVNCISKNISLSFDPDDLLLDNTSSVMDNATYSTEIISGITYIDVLNFAIDPNSTIAIKFYKLDPTANYTYPLNNNSSIITVTVTDPVV